MNLLIFRDFFCRNISLIILLVAYFLLTVVGNLIYLVPDGDVIGRYAIVGFSIQNFETAKSASYFLLLFSPFLVVPLIALGTRRLLGQKIRTVSELLVEFSPIDYLIIVSIIYAYVVYSFWRVDAVGLIIRGDDVYSAVKSRFELLALLGYWPQVALKSLLMFLTSYAIVRAIRTHVRFWVCAALANFVAMSALLLLLNMKWPLLIFYLAVALAAFCFSPKHPYIAAIIISLFMVTAYGTISAALLRIIPSPAYTEVEVVPIEKPNGAAPPSLSSSFQFFGNATQAALQNSTLLGITLINRMAQPYPYYFDTFTKRGSVCGTIIDRIKRKPNPCQPSNLIYSEMFSDGLFALTRGQGTAPQAVHITGYALNGWPGALVELLIASVIIGLFISLNPTTDVSATIMIMGGLTAYFFSQLPVEGPIIYDHGIFWWALLLVFYSLFRLVRSQNIKAPQPTTSV